MSREILDPEDAKLICDPRIPYDVALVIENKYLIPVTSLLMTLRRLGVKGLTNPFLGQGNGKTE
jgi:hypothetical protein